MAELGVCVGLPVRLEKFLQRLHAIQMFRSDAFANLLPHLRKAAHFIAGARRKPATAAGFQAGIIAGGVDGRQHREQILAAIQLALRSARFGLGECDGGDSDD